MSYKAFISYSRNDDPELASALQFALERLAKPWYQMRAFPVFRDSTNLTVSPDLSSDIESALRDSEFLIVMASPNAAKSEWIEKEIAFWRQHKSIDKLLLVIIAGEPKWDDSEGFLSNDPNANPIPTSLRKAFANQPTWLTFPKLPSSEWSLDNEEFLDAVAMLAAPLHGKKDKTEIYNLHVREHRKTMGMACAAIAGLLILFIAAVVFARRAETQRLVAERQERLARDNRAHAEIQSGATAFDSGNISHALLWWSKSRATAYIPSMDDSLRSLIGAWSDSVTTLPHDYSIKMISFTADGTSLLTHCDDGALRQWNLRTGSLERNPLMPHRARRVLAVDGVERCLYVADDDNHSAYVWNMITKQLVRLPTVVAEITAATFSPDGSLIAIGMGVTELFVYDSATGTTQCALAHSQGAWPLTFTSDSSRLLTRSADRIHLWSTDGHELQPPLYFKSIQTAKASNDGRYVAVACKKSDGFTNIKVIDVEKWDHSDLHLTLTADTISDMAISSSGRFIATGSYDGSMQVWSVNRGIQLGTSIQINDAIRHIAFSHNDRRIAASGLDYAVRLWRTSDFAPSMTDGYAIPARHDKRGLVAFSPDGARFATTSVDGRVHVWDAGTGQLLCGLPASGRRVTALGFSYSGDVIAVGTENRFVEFWNVPHNEPIGHSDQLPYCVESIAFSADGRRVVTSSPWHSEIHVLSVPEGKRIGLPIDAGVLTRLVAISPDGERVFVASHKRIVVADVNTGKVAPGPSESEKPYSAVALAMNGTRLVTADGFGVVRMWDASTSAPIGKPMQHEGRAIVNLAINTKGTRVMTLSMCHDDRAHGMYCLQAWDLMSCKPLTVPVLVCDSQFAGISFGRDGSRMILRKGANVSWFDLRAPAMAEPKRLEYSSKVRTARTINVTGEPRRLSFDEWNKCREELASPGGP